MICRMMRVVGCCSLLFVVDCCFFDVGEVGCVVAVVCCSLVLFVH